MLKKANMHHAGGPILGNRGMDLLYDVAKKNGVTLLYDGIANDNPAITFFLKHGFVEEYRTDEIIMLKKEL